MCGYNKISSNLGLTFLEILVALFILTISLLGFFQMFNTSIETSYRAKQELIAINLARGLLAEIVSKDFVDPDDPSRTSLGRDTVDGESTRNTFDDVDDYDYFRNNPENPPYTVGGEPLNGTGGRPDYSAFTRTVTVSYCDISGNNIIVVGGPTDYKHITVTAGGPYVRDISVDEVKVRE